MKRIMALAAAAVLATSGAAAAAPVPASGPAPVAGGDRIGSWRDFPGVSNSSFVEPNGDRALQLSIEVPASPDEVFAAFATSEGFRSWAAPVAKIELRVGGMIES